MVRVEPSKLELVLTVLDQSGRAMVRVSHRSTATPWVHTSVASLKKDVREWIADWNENPKPFAWTKTADEILNSLAQYIQRISGARH